MLARDEVNEEDDDGDRQLHEGHGQLDHLDAAREARADAAQRYRDKPEGDADDGEEEREEGEGQGEQEPEGPAVTHP